MATLCPSGVAQYKLEDGLKGLDVGDGVVRFPEEQLAMGAILLEQEDAGHIHVENFTHQNAQAHMRITRQGRTKAFNVSRLLPPFPFAPHNTIDFPLSFSISDTNIAKVEDLYADGYMLTITITEPSTADACGAAGGVGVPEKEWEDVYYYDEEDDGESEAEGVVASEEEKES
ncbi:unnamed protein product [Vitrella brassicaformis CCMP3155]|uniref:Uncharacterized protein n=1 Tax=Vitrella brassicaformis (strain CCMP3155) TaxID=1169540 RepID=A0A0G4FWH6_VITBC|nr:unnamed protein product [Vitrella brassicaformis CCMP3155]|eukprot:CEM19488.1 unnamed protein product [Vitrella brassicaformis CCMP3155]